ncbi:MAG TPA: oligosaccharide flippase family protein [Acidobacteriaceae bacterium]|nr:oligosaccharide flippase family protein [Acidobacteriaceae bacterium]
MTIDAEIDRTESSLAGDDLEQVHQRALESRALKGTYFVVLFYGASMALRMVSSVVLTHFFAPELFGLMALVTTFIVGLTLFSHIGLEDSIIQNPRGDDEIFLNTAWTIQTIRGTGIFVTTLLLAWPAAQLYHDPRWIYLLPILGFGCVIAGFSSPNLLMLSRHLGVGRLSTLELATQFVLFASTVLCAIYWTRTVWALAFGRIVSELFRTIWSYWIAGKHGGYRPRFVLERKAIHALVTFGRWILIGTVLTFLAQQSDRLILSKLTTYTMLGIYNIAFQLSDVPRQVILMFSSKVGFPFIAKLAHKPRPEFRAVLIKYRGMVLIAGAVLLTITICVGDIFIRLVYDARYQQASWMIALLALGLWHTLLYSTVTPAILSLQKAHYNAVANLLYFIALCILLPTGFHYFGMVGAVGAVAISDLPMYFVNLYASYRQGLGMLRQDLLMTLSFFALLTLGLTIRHLCGIGFPFPPLAHAPIF